MNFQSTKKLCIVVGAGLLVGLVLACKPEDEPTAERDPVTMTAQPSNIGWLLHFEVPDQAAAISYRLENEPDFAEMYQNTISIPLGSKPVKILVKYQDSAGATHGPFELIHEPRAALAENSKRTLESLPTGWVYLLDENDNKLIYWTSLLSHRCGVDLVEYGINTMTPTLTYDLGNCNVDDPLRLPDDNSLLYSFLPENTNFVSVRLVYTDGTKSKVQKFDRFDNL